MPKNLSEIGESDEQRATKELPVFGVFTKPYMDWKYGRISEAEAVRGVFVNVATGWATAEVGGTALKGAGKLSELEQLSFRNCLPNQSSELGSRGI